MGLLTCTKCKETKDETEYYKCSTNKTGRHGECKKCRSNLRRLREQTPEGKRKKSERAAKYKADDPRKWLLYSAKYRAKKQGVPFNLTKDDIVIPKVCPIYGIPLVISKGRPTDNSPSLDKLIPSLGYTKFNVNVISHLANKHKSDMSLQQMKLMLQWTQSKLKESLNDK